MGQRETNEVNCLGIISKRIQIVHRIVMFEKSVDKRDMFARTYRPYNLNLKK